MLMLCGGLRDGEKEGPKKSGVRSEKAKDSSRYQKTITTTTCIFTFYHSVPRNKVTIGDFIVGKIEGR